MVLGIVKASLEILGIDIGVKKVVLLMSDVNVCCYVGDESSYTKMVATLSAQTEP